MRIVFYDAYHVIPYSTMKFQADTLSFDWILETVTFQLPIVFHLVFYQSNPKNLHATKGIPSIGVLRTYVQNFSSI